MFYEDRLSPKATIENYFFYNFFSKTDEVILEKSAKYI